MYKTKTKAWFLKRIGKRIYRDDNECSCPTCAEILKNGLIVHDEQHADYLACMDGVYCNYSDERPVDNSQQDGGHIV